MKNVLFIVFFILSVKHSFGQVCTLTQNRTFANIASATCGEGGTPSSGDLIIIPSGFTLETSATNQNITYNIQIGNGGIFRIANNNAVLNGSIVVKNGGLFDLDAKLTMPSGETLAVEKDGVVDSGATGSDRLTIGTTVILSGTTPCTDPDGTSDTSPPYCAASGFTGPTGFDENGETPTILPIVLGSFTITQRSKNIELEWQTITEENFDFFSIERSENGENFYEIGTVPGHGDSNDPINYSFVDEHPLFGLSYYRLNAIDYDGTYEKFQILPVEFIPDDLQVIVYPNPGNGNNTTLTLGLPVDANLKTVTIYSLSGEQILEKTLEVGKNDLEFQKRLDKGLYFAKVQIDNYTITQKLIIN